MFILEILSNPLVGIGFIAGLAIALTIHESAHAYVAYRLGDHTAKNEGRISLNPLHHLDPVGTLLLFVTGFGWGKPVPINPHNLNNPKIDSMKIALAGPLSNLLMAVLLSIILRFIPFSEIGLTIIIYVITINLTLMIFNLLPIPPLDGSSIIGAVFSDEVTDSFHQLSMPLLMAFLIFAFTTNYLNIFISLIINFFFKILL